MGFGHCLASQFPRIPTVCHGHPVQSFDHVCPLKRAWTFKPCQSLAERRGFEPRKPFWSLHAFQACLFNHSSLRTTPKMNFSGYPQRGFFKIGYKITTNYSYTQVFWQLFFILLHFFVDYLHISKKNTTFAPRINEKIVND